MPQPHSCDHQVGQSPFIEESLSLPQNYEKRDASLFTDAKFAYPRPFTRVIHDVFCESSGLLHKKGVFLEESFFDYWRAENQRISLKKCWPLNWHGRSTLRQNFSLEKKLWEIDEAVYMMDHLSQAYYHWLIEALPRLMLAEEKYFRGPLILLEDARAPFIRESLSLMGYNDWIILHPEDRLRIKTLNISLKLSHDGSIHPFYINKVKQRFLSALGLSPQAHPFRRIYISRAKAKYRYFVNEEELLALLQQHGFEVLYPEELALKDVVVKLHEASFLLGQHGAGLSNMLFMPKGSSILEIGVPSFFPLHYYYLAHALKQVYYYTVDVHSVPERGLCWNQNLELDIRTFEKRLLACLADTSSLNLARFHSQS